MPPTWLWLTSNRYELGVLEFNRAWNYWLGLPVPPRVWKVKVPSRDEL